MTCIEIRGKRKITLLPFVVTTDKFLDCNSYCTAINFMDVTYGTVQPRISFKYRKTVVVYVRENHGTFCPFPSVLQSLSPSKKKENLSPDMNRDILLISESTSVMAQGYKNFITSDQNLSLLKNSSILPVFSQLY